MLRHKPLTRWNPPPPLQDAWVRQFYEQVQLPASRGGGAGQRPNTLSQRLWSREITDELWL